MVRHNDLVVEIRAAKPKVVFLGDSIMSYWLSRGRTAWDANYARLDAFDAGIASDTTENVLWRIDHGLFDSVSPSVVVLLIGINDELVFSPGDVAHGITAVVDDIHERLPQARILLLGLLPRGQTSRTASRQAVVATNAVLASATLPSGVTYDDIGPAFLQPNGDQTPDLFDPVDHEHPTLAGYDLWATQMQPTLIRLLGQ